MLSISLSLALLFACAYGMDGPKYKNTTFSPNVWLNRYELVTVLLKMQSLNMTETSDSSGSVLYRLTETLSFFAYGKFFKIKLTREPLYAFGNTKTRPSNELKVRFYRGIVYKPCISTRAVIMVTSEGLNAMIVTDSDIYFIEPATRVTQYSLNTTDISPTPNVTTSLNTHHCLVYRASDVRENKTSFIDAELYSTYTAKGSFGNTNHAKQRSKRSTGQTECMLHIVADHLYYEQVGGYDYLKTLAEMKYLVKGADLLFRGVDFNGDGQGDGIGFYIANVTVFYPSDTYKMKHETDVLNYLNSFSKYDFNDYCLGIAFSGREFADGVIGLAYMASSSVYGAAGGICQNKRYFQSEYRSLNTALVSPFTYGEKLPVYKTMLTLTHEFGHSFGSPHDDSIDKNCAPANEFGNYIMYPYANDGSKPNHNEFSQCSLDSMYPVIKYKGGCFKQKQGGVCGNGITEDGEECDCGSSAVCGYVDPCCTPSDVSASDPDYPCTFRKSQGKVCSPKEMTCCTESCMVMPATPGHVCKAGIECVVVSKCDGIHAECPEAVLKKDKVLCDNGRKTCLSGMCIGSVCNLVNGTTCSCGEPNLCHVCCVTNVTECSPALSATGDFVQKSPGESCSNMKGYCSTGKCILLDPESTINRLADMFTEEGIKDVKGWIKTYWYYVVAGGAAVGFLAALFMAHCRGEGSVHTRAYMYGQFARIEREAAIQKEYLVTRRQSLVNSSRDQLEHLDGTISNEMCLAKAIARLTIFFPTAPQHVIEQTLKISFSEEVAVKMLVVRGYPFRRVCVPGSESNGRQDECD